MMPLGAYTKVETRKMAEQYKLPVAHKPDSQEICFVPKDDYKTYLKALTDSSFYTVVFNIFMFVGLQNFLFAQNKKHFIGKWKMERVEFTFKSPNPSQEMIDETNAIKSQMVQDAKDKIFAEFWEHYKLDSIAGQWDYIEPVMFGYAAAKVIDPF